MHEIDNHRQIAKVTAKAKERQLQNRMMEIVRERKGERVWQDATGGFTF